MDWTSLVRPTMRRVLAPASVFVLLATAFRTGDVHREGVSTWPASDVVSYIQTMDQLGNSSMEGEAETGERHMPSLDTDNDGAGPDEKTMDQPSNSSMEGEAETGERHMPSLDTDNDGAGPDEKAGDGTTAGGPPAVPDDQPTQASQAGDGTTAGDPPADPDDQPTQASQAAAQPRRNRVPKWVQIALSSVAWATIIIVVLFVSRQFGEGLPLLTSRASEDDLRAAAKASADRAESMERSATSGEQFSAAAKAAREAMKHVESKQELLGEMLLRTRALEEAGQVGARTLTKKTLPLVGKAVNTATTLQIGVSRLRQQVSTMAHNELFAIAHKVQTSLQEKMPDIQVPKWLEPGADLSKGLPPMSLLLSALVAPAELKSMAAGMKFEVFTSTSGFATAVAVFFIDLEEPCKDGLVWPWIGIVLGCCFLTISSRVMVLRIAGKALLELEVLHTRRDQLTSSGNDVWDAFVNLHADTDGFFVGLVHYEEILRSKAYKFSKFSHVLSVFVGLYGVWISVFRLAEHEGIEGHEPCEARTALLFLHLHAFFSVVLLSWSVATLGLWILRSSAADNFIRTPIVKFVQDIDRDMPFKLPVLTTLVQAFVLRDASDLMKIKEQTLNSEVAILQKELQEAEKEQKELEQEIGTSHKLAVQATAEAEKAIEQEQKWIDSYKVLNKDKLADLTPFVQVVHGVAVPRTAGGEVELQESGLAGRD